MELAQVPAWNFADHIVEGWLEESRCCLRDGVLQFKKSITHGQLGSHKRQWVSSSFGGQSRRTAQAGVDLNDTVILAVGVESVLDIALTDNTDMPDDLDRQSAKFVILAV